jgi:glutathione synthase/RimK-type ligase-like ATP-grasp enzyme
MGLARPTSEILRQGEMLKPNLIAKREFSDCAQHIIFSGQKGKRWDKIRGTVEGPHRWFVQTYMPYLKDFGEWRAFVVGGKVKVIIHTTPKNGDWDWEVVDQDRIFSLEEIGYYFSDDTLCRLLIRDVV